MIAVLECVFIFYPTRVHIRLHQSAGVVGCISDAVMDTYCAEQKWYKWSGNTRRIVI